MSDIVDAAEGLSGLSVEVLALLVALAAFALAGFCVHVATRSRGRD